MVRWPKVASVQSAARYLIHIIQRRIAKQLVDGKLVLKCRLVVTY
jgi:hypothetical protein